MRDELLSQLHYDEAVIIMDYKEKCLPSAHYEAQSEAFCKAGISVHGAVVLAYSLPKHLVKASLLT